MLKLLCLVMCKLFREAEMELLVLLIFFHLILDINSQNLPQPQLSVSPEVITQRGSVQLHCHVPDHVKVYQCSFYPETQNTNVENSPSCQLSVTGSELIRWTGHRSPKALRIICFYALDKTVRTPSPHSLPAPVTVLYQKPILSVNYDNQTDEFRLSCEIPESESVTADVSCYLYTGENPQPYRKIRRSKTRKSGRFSCIFEVQRNDMFNVLQPVKSSEVSCDYSLSSDSTARSLMSDKYNLIPFFPTPTQTSTTVTSTAGLFSTLTQTSTTETSTGLFPSPKQTSTTETSAGSFPTITQTSTTETFTTASPASTTDLINTTHITTHLSSEVPSTSSTTNEKTHSPPETSTTGSFFVLILSVHAVSVSLAALMSFGLCWFIKKQKAESRRKLDVTRGDQGPMLPMINLSSSGADADESYAVITSVPLPALPLDPSGDVKKDSKKPEDDVYHVYSSIIDTPGVSSDREVSLYSLLQSH
ncbi:flocculation protein FLO11-like isoform X9 [Tachysurus fulvidraco]|uniref:flocculation protein FLO11-like isoform X9 n=1 Tax=Tachysurus fulvidraco TaxID=1234273 RepID=UPI001FED2D3D|nr:flocculation protein FLO11-like isoform X9 [Tachysurus fulvidraco]